jgi:hypothetical protein
MTLAKHELTVMKDISLRQARAVDAEAIHELHLNSVRALCASSYERGISMGG